ncbi:hypothetical protein VQH23_14940 [Pararoseomonas sp. SCSIO 73927]|uniref:hypothetical protein n=1 Tax=Pararoseomonas sp. SCSIO 73927 TaxID=3114537 RepID=UPI0030D59738
MPIHAASGQPGPPGPTRSTDWLVAQTFQVIEESWRILAASRQADHWPRFRRALPADARGAEASPDRPEAG